MKEFEYDNGDFYCKKEDDGKVHNVRIDLDITNASISYEIECGRLRKPTLSNVHTNNFIGLYCTCGVCEDISKEFTISDGYIKPSIPESEGDCITYLDFE